MQPKTERNARIIEMRKNGAKPYQIAEELGITRNTVLGVLYKAGMCREGHHARGEEQGRSARLNDATVRDIRQRYRRWSRTDGASAIARELGVHSRTVRDVVRGRTWSHVQ
jgi:predicted transcriptional regulator